MDCTGGHDLTVPRPKARYLVGRDAVMRNWIERLPTSLRDRLVLSRMPKYGTDAEIPRNELREAGCEDLRR